MKPSIYTMLIFMQQGRVGGKNNLLIANKTLLEKGLIEAILGRRGIFDSFKCFLDMTKSLRRNHRVLKFLLVTYFPTINLS